ncbi:MAG: efflux RND transporter periplasmic adaptor subunit [Rubrivivax sp.]|nr:MAG: efflux RND transporter periplasmic adaptor subunit [Rubrivivax sp.]
MLRPVVGTSFFRGAVLSVALAGLLAGCGKKDGAAEGAGAPPPAAVAVQAVMPADVPAVFEFVGQTAGSREVEVRARVGGILIKRNFAEGGLVRQGQSLYTLDAAPFQAALNRAEADVAIAEARLAQATRVLNRYKPLLEGKAVSQGDYDEAASAEQVARADLKGAQARRSEAQLSIAYARVEAPISGVVGRSLPSEGTLVAGPETLLTTVTQTDPVKVRFGIADTDQMAWRNDIGAGRLRLPPGQAFEVEVKLADGSTYARKGRLLFADARVSTTTGTIEAEAEVPNPQGELKPGQFVRVRLLGGVRPGAVRVASRAVLEGPQGKFVYVVEGGKAAARPVTVGEQQGDLWVITQGLKAGDQVIVDGVMRIGPGAPVQAVPASAPAAASK